MNTNTNLPSQLLDPDQEIAVNTDAPRCLVIAGAGSGKTHTLVEHIRYLVGQRYEPQEICAITFTNSGAGVMRERLPAIIGQPIGFTGTLHALMLRSLNATRTEALSVLSGEEADDLLFEIRDKQKCKTKKETLIAMRRDWWKLSGIQARDIKPEHRVVQSYYQQILADGMIDYDGILWRGLILLRNLAPTEFKFRVVLVDEFQDSAAIDLEIYQTMFKRMFCTLYIVGDPDQAIYGFRGGCVDNIVKLGQAWDFAQAHGSGGAPEMDSAVVRLQRNYRSDAGICTVANRLIAHNKNRLDKQLIPQSADPGEAVCRHFQTQLEHDSEVTKIVMAEAGREKPEQIAVLARTHSICQQAITHLEAAGIKCQRHEKMNFPEDWLILKMALALMASPYNWPQYERYLKRIGKPLGPVWETAEIKKTMKPHQHGKYPATTDVRRAIDGLTAFPISMVAIEAVKEWVNAHPAIGSVDELLLALQNEELKTVQKEGVFVGTLHAAKGREFNAVVLAGIEEGVLPKKDAVGDELEEDRRLLYVGITRARHRLYMISAGQRTVSYNPKFSESIETGQSRFIQEILQAKNSA